MKNKPCEKQHYCLKSSDITDMTRHIHEYRMWVPIGIYLSYPTSFRESLGLAWSSSRILHAFSSRVLFIRTNTASTLERLISHGFVSAFTSETVHQLLIINIEQLASASLRLALRA